MPTANLTRATIWEAGDATELARVEANGADVTKAVVSAIQRTITNITTETLVSSSAMTVASTGGGVIHDTLQTDARWTVDDDGYNFRDRVPGSKFALPGKRFRVEYKFTGSGTPAETYFLAYEHDVRDTRST